MPVVYCTIADVTHRFVTSLCNFNITTRACKWTLCRSMFRNEEKHIILMLIIDNFIEVYNNLVIELVQCFGTSFFGRIDHLASSVLKFRPKNTSYQRYHTCVTSLIRRFFTVRSSLKNSACSRGDHAFTRNWICWCTRDIFIINIIIIGILLYYEIKRQYWWDVRSYKQSMSCFSLILYEILWLLQNTWEIV